MKPIILLAYCSISLLITLYVGASSGHAASNPPTELHCEWRVNPKYVADRAPELTWKAEPQTAYRLLVSQSRSALTEKRGDVWDSGKVMSKLSIVEYAGQPLENNTTYFWTVQIWNEARQAGGFSPVQQFAIKFAALPSRLPHIRTFLNFGSDPETIAKQYDLTFRREAKEFRKEILTFNYSLLATMVIQSEKTEMLERFCVKNGLTESGIDEEMFLHFARDTNITLHVGAERAENPRETRLVPGWGPANDRNGDGIVDDEEFASLVHPDATARRMQDARVPIYYWGPPNDDFVMNVGHPEYQRFLAEEYVSMQLQGYDGMYVDTTPPQVPGPGGKAEILEYPISDKWFLDMLRLLARIKMVHPDNPVTANNWRAKPFVIDGTQWEGWLNITSSVTAVESRLQTTVDLEKRGKIQLAQYNPVYDEKTSSFGRKAPVTKDRDRLYALATYYLIQGDYTYFGYGQHPYAGSERMWFPAIEVDIGKPVGEYFIFDEGGKLPPEGENLLHNGGFEKELQGWERADPVEIDFKIKRSGKASVKIASPSITTNNINKQYVTLEPHTTYTLFGWMRTENIAGSPGAQIYLYEFDDSQSSLQQINVTGTTNWKLYRIAFTTGEDATGRINFRVYGATGTAWFDDITLVKGSYVHWKVFARKYEKGLVLVKPTPGGQFGDDTATEHELSRVFRPLGSDGTLGQPLERIRLRSGEAAILFQ